MLLASALNHLLRIWDSGHLDPASSRLEQLVPVTLIQIMNRTLLDQSSDGSWGFGSVEVTAYAVLCLASVSPFPWTCLVRDQISCALEKGQQFLSHSRERWAKPERIWVEKVNYGSDVLSRSYCIAAMHSRVSTQEWGSAVTKLLNNSSTTVSNLTKMFSILPIFSKTPHWILDASILEGRTFLPELQRVKTEIFADETSAMAKDKYMEYIPCTWAAIKNSKKLFVNSTILWDMMIISMLDFLIDEYMESTIVQLCDTDLDFVSDIIRRLCSGQFAQTGVKRKRDCSDDEFDCSNGHPVTTTKGVGTSEITTKMMITLERFIKYILNHSHVLLASDSDKSQLLTELQVFLIAHITQIQDNNRFSRQISHSSNKISTFLTPRTSYYTWVHTTAAEHISCPFSFAFYTCLIGASSSTPSTDCFSSVQQKYLAHDLCMHLAVMSRLYNDYASVRRDCEEKNLNSVNFPEFRARGSEVSTRQEGDDGLLEKEEEVRQKVLALADYEKACARVAGERLGCELRKDGRGRESIWEAMELFSAVTELYAELYVVRDLSNRVK